eukprot:m.162496 g.162496  ORF g.162496 m.162496 type:complete len:305 (+) comp16534_c0_seq1:1778-2692(+)
MAKATLIKAVHGGLLAEAATMPLHWIYDATKLAEIVGSKSPEFFETLSCPFYKHQAGQWSPYGAEGAATAAALVAGGKDFDGQAAAKAFGDWFKSWDGYMNHSVKTTLANLEAGKTFPLVADPTDCQVNSCIKVPLALLAYHEADWQAKMPAVFQLSQSQSLPLSCGLAFAAVLDKVVQGMTPLAAVEALAADEKTGVPSDQRALLQDVLDSRDASLETKRADWGPSCMLPGAFKLALLVVLQASDYLDGVRKNIMLGGDNCSRAVIVGSLLAGQADVSLLDDFAAKTTGFEEVKQATAALAAL